MNINRPVAVYGEKAIGVRHSLSHKNSLKRIKARSSGLDVINKSSLNHKIKYDFFLKLNSNYLILFP